MQHQRYLELYGVNPVSGDGFDHLSVHARQLGHDVVDARGQVVALQFSTAVEAAYAPATAQDHQPLTVAAQAGKAAAQAADTSAEINRRGVADISGNAREEVAQIAAIPDPDSPEGQAAILTIIGQHQAKASQIVTDSATAEQAAGQQAAGSGNGAHIQMVDNTSGTPPVSPLDSQACEDAIAQQQKDVLKKILADMGKGAALGGLAGVTVDGVGALPGAIVGGGLGGIGGVIDWATSPNKLPTQCT